MKLQKNGLKKKENIEKMQKIQTIVDQHLLERKLNLNSKEKKRRKRKRQLHLHIVTQVDIVIVLPQHPQKLRRVLMRLSMTK